MFLTDGGVSSFIDHYVIIVRGLFKIEFKFEEATKTPMSREENFEISQFCFDGRISSSDYRKIFSKLAFQFIELFRNG